MLKNKSISTANPVIYFQVGFFFFKVPPPQIFFFRKQNKIWDYKNKMFLHPGNLRTFFFGVGGELIPLELDPTKGINLHIGD